MRRYKNHTNSSPTRSAKPLLQQDHRPRQGTKEQGLRPHKRRVSVGDLLLCEVVLGSELTFGELLSRLVKQRDLAFTYLVVGLEV